MRDGEAAAQGALGLLIGRVGTVITAALAILVTTAVSGALATQRSPAARAHRGPINVGATITPMTFTEPSCTTYASPRGRAPAKGRFPNTPTTVTAALDRASAGNVVCLEPGTYDTTGNIYIPHSGTPQAPVYIRSYGPSVLLKYTGRHSLDGGVLQTYSGADWRGVHDVVIDGLTIDGGDHIGGGIFVTNGSHNVTIRNCVIYDTGATGIGVNAADYVNVEHNVIYHVGYDQGYSSGISLWYGGLTATFGGHTAWYNRAPGFHNVIADNVVAGAYDNSSIHSEGNGIIVDGAGSIPPVLIANDLVYENGGRGIASYVNSGSVWMVNDTAYADGLDLRIGHTHASEFAGIQAANVHMINDLAYSRRQRGRYVTGYVFSRFGGRVALTRSIGFNGSTLGFKRDVKGNPRAFRYVNPRWLRPPAIPAGSTPWASAIPPWSIGSDFTLRAGSPALGTGVDPASLQGVGPLAAALRRFVPTSATGRAGH